MSTSLMCGGRPTSKKFNSWVSPGVFDVLAQPLRLVTPLRSALFPTFERPAKAISGAIGSGRNFSPGADFRKSTGPEKSLRARSVSSSWVPSTSGRRRMRVREVQPVLLVKPPLLQDRQHVAGHPVELQPAGERCHHEH